MSEIIGGCSRCAKHLTAEDEMVLDERRDLLCGTCAREVKEKRLGKASENLLD